jgi:ADP-ribosylglycohydrolase/catechol 2,3-dioxygenase-like lactoylglutathione lyase family enzyme
VPGHSELRTRAHGAMLGLAVGDALGWPIEDRGGRVGGTAKVQPALDFKEWQRREGGGYAPHQEVIAPGEYSDDTQLALAVARSRTVGAAWWEHLTEVELPLWTVYERGGGGAIKRAAQAWLSGHAPWEEKSQDAVRRYLSAGGNGAVMRCLPHALLREAAHADLRNTALDLDALATHGHPRALLGSRLYGAAVSWALRRDEPLAYGGLVQRLIQTAPEWGAMPSLPDRILATSAVGGREWQEVWWQASEETLHLLRVSLDGLAQGAVAIDRPVLEDLGAFGAAKGAGTVTAVAAIFLASRYVSQPQQGLLAAAFARGADTDTLASLVAALLGALHGPDWLGQLSLRVQDGKYIASLTDHVLDDRPASLARGPWHKAERTRLYRWLDEAGRSDASTMGPFGDITVSQIRDHETRTTFVRSWDLLTEVGQTLKIKRYDRGRDGMPRWRLKPEVAARPEPEAPPRAGLILRVADLGRAREFYEHAIGLKVQRATEEYISFGWLALEVAGEGGYPLQLTAPTPPRDPGQLIRVYLAEDALMPARMRIGALGLPISEAPGRPLGRSFRCCDADGHVVEFVARNGRPAVV